MDVFIFFLYTYKSHLSALCIFVFAYLNLVLYVYNILIHSSVKGKNVRIWVCEKEEVMVLSG